MYYLGSRFPGAWIAVQYVQANSYRFHDFMISWFHDYGNRVGNETPTFTCSWPVTRCATWFATWFATQGVIGAYIHTVHQSITVVTLMCQTHSSALSTSVDECFVHLPYRAHLANACCDRRCGLLRLFVPVAWTAHWCGLALYILCVQKLGLFAPNRASFPTVYFKVVIRSFDALSYTALNQRKH